MRFVVQRSGKYHLFSWNLVSRFEYGLPGVMGLWGYAIAMLLCTIATTIYQMLPQRLQLSRNLVRIQHYLHEHVPCFSILLQGFHDPRSMLFHVHCKPQFRNPRSDNDGIRFSGVRHGGHLRMSKNHEGDGLTFDERSIFLRCGHRRKASIANTVRNNVALI
jgi:hypothetical protein